MFKSPLQYANKFFKLSHEPDKGIKQRSDNLTEEELKDEWRKRYTNALAQFDIPLLEVPLKESKSQKEQNPFKRLPDPFDYNAIQVPEEFARLRKPGQQPFWVHYSQKDQMLVLRTNQGRWLVNHIIPEGPVLWRTVEVQDSWPLRKIVMGWATRVPVRKDNNAYPQP